WRLAYRRKHGRDVANERARPVQEKACECICEAGLRITVPRGGSRLEIPLTARIEDAGPQIIHEVTNIDSKLDRVIPRDFRPVIHEIEVRLRARPRLVGGKAEHRVAESVDVDGRQAARRRIEIDAWYPQIVRDRRAKVLLLGHVAVPAKSETNLRYK